MNIDGDALQLLIGVVGGPVAIIALVNHIKLFFASMPWTVGEWTEGVEASPWPLITDALGVVWAFALHDSGVLDAIPGVADLRWPAVVLVGLVVFGLGSSAVVDQKRAIVARAQGNTPPTV